MVLRLDGPKKSKNKGTTLSEAPHLSRLGRDIDIGQGRLGFLLAHGLGGTPVELRFVAEGLARSGFAVTVPLLHGHGGSDDLLNSTRWQDWYASFEAGYERLRQRCDIIVVGGLSVGALMALHMAREHPAGVHGAALFSPTMWPNGWAIPWTFQIFRIIRMKWLANLFKFHEVAPYGIKDERIRRFVLDSLQSGEDKRSLDEIFGRRGGTILEFRWMVEKIRGDLASVKQPVLIFHPRFDDQSDMSNTMYLERRLGGRVQTIVLEDSYHMVTLDRQRAVVVEDTVEFARRLERQLVGTQVAGDRARRL